MKKFTIFVLDLFMIVSLCKPVLAIDHYVHKNYNIVVQSNPNDPRDLIKITTQYLCNEDRRFCECLSIAYEVISSSPAIALNIKVSKQNLQSGIGGAIAKVKVSKASSSFRNTAFTTLKKILISMKFMPDGTASHTIKIS